MLQRPRGLHQRSRRIPCRSIPASYPGGRLGHEAPIRKDESLSSSLSDEEKKRVQRLLKGFPAGTEEAFYRFRETGNADSLPALIGGMVGFYLPSTNPLYMQIIEPEMELQTIGIDSLAMTEFVFQVEELFDVSVADDEVAQVKNVQDIARFILGKVNPGDAGNNPTAGE